MPDNKEFAEHLNDVKAEAEAYIDKTTEYYKLLSLKAAAKVSSTVARVMLVAVMIAFALFFLSVAAVVFIGNLTGSMVIGLLVVAALYVVLSVVMYYFGRHFIDPAIISGFTKVFYKNDADE